MSLKSMLVLLLAATALTIDCVNAESNPPTERLSDQQAKALALKVHANVAAAEQLPRFYYRARSGNGDIVSMSNRDELCLAGLTEALDAAVIEKDWLEWTAILAWTRHHAYWVNREREGVKFGPGRNIGVQERVWTRKIAFERMSSDRGPTSFVFSRTPDQLWQGCLREFAYFRAGPHQFWWASSDDHNDQINWVSPQVADYRHLKIEDFDGESCYLIESPSCATHMWISRDSGRLRGLMTFLGSGKVRKIPFFEEESLQRIAGRTFSSMTDYSEWIDGTLVTAEQKDRVSRFLTELHFEGLHPNELIRFRDYREVSPGIWIPFREDRAFTHRAVGDRSKFKYIRLWVSVVEVKTDVDLTETIGSLQPKEGEPVQDQRFGVVLNYHYENDRTHAQLMEMAEAQRKEQK